MPDECAWYSITCNLADLAGSIAGDSAKTMANAALQSANQVTAEMTAWWISYVPTSGVDSTAVSNVQSMIKPFVAIALIVSVLVAAAQLIWHQRGSPLKELARSLIVFLTISAAGVAGLQLLIEGMDAFSGWIVGQAGIATDFAVRILAMENLGPYGSMFMLLFSIVVIVVGILQMILLIFRAAMLNLLTAVLPLAVAMTNFETGKEWAKRASGWILGFLLYKPMAAIIFALGIQMATATGATSTSNALVQSTTGLMILVASLIALPALIKFISPATASIGSGGLAVGAMAGMAATGAVEVSRMRMTQNSGESASAATPTGATPAVSGGSSAPALSAGTSSASTAASTGAGASSAAASGASAAATGGTSLVVQAAVSTGQKLSESVSTQVYEAADGA